MTKQRSSQDSKKLKFDQSVLAVADQFLGSAEMPEAGIHFSRLRSAGHSDESAKRMIGSVLIAHVYLAKKMNTAINRAQIRVELTKLPKLGFTPDGMEIDIRDVT